MSDKPLLVCHDLQRAFVEDGPLRAPRGAEALLECGRLLSFARRNNWTVAHCYLHGDAGPFHLDAHGALPIGGFEPRPHESVLVRTTLSAYGHAAFRSLVESAPRHGVLVSALSASLTLLATIFEAFARGHRLVVAADAMAAQEGLEASAAQHEACVRDLCAFLAFPVVGARRPLCGPHAHSQLSCIIGGET